MEAILKKTIIKSVIVAFSFMAALVCATISPSASDAFIERRITTGAKIFRALLAADFDLSEKTISGTNLKLFLLYVDNDDNARKAAATLRLHDNARIKQLATTIEIVPFSRFVKNETEEISGIFLSQPLDDDSLNLVIKRAITQRIVVFSPFDGDVERGIQSGLAVESRVRPYLNTKALQVAEIRLKSFFLRVAKHYEK